MGILFLNLQGTLLAKWAFRGYFLDLEGLLIIFLGISFPLRSALGIALVLGFLFDIFSGSPLGLGAGTFMVLVLAGQAIRSQSMMSGFWFNMGVILVLTLLEGVLFQAGTVFLKNLEWDREMWGRILFQAVFMALVGPVIFQGFQSAYQRLVTWERGGKIRL
jgi:rod shape-determining protein MreD